MANNTPLPSNLDFEQAIRGAYDDVNGVFRTTAQIVAPIDVNGEVLVDIRAGDGDSVLIYGTTNGQTTGTPQVLKVNSDGSINVNATIVNEVSNQTVISPYNTISSVSSGTLTTIISYTVPVSTKTYLNNIEYSGSNTAIYEVYINSVLQARQRSYFGGSLNGNFIYEATSDNGLTLSTGDVVQVKVTHFRPDVGDFDARILAIEEIIP